MKGTSSPPDGRFQRRPSLGTSIARAMISMSPDVNFDTFSERSASLSIRLCDSLRSSNSRTSCFSPSTAISHVTGSSSTLHSTTTEYEKEFVTFFLKFLCRLGEMEVQIFKIIR